MFECEYKTQLLEEWNDDAWTVDQGGRTDKRIEYLDQMLHYTSERDVALYGDGSYIEGGCVTYSAQPFKFCNDLQYFDDAEDVCAAIKARLPNRFGYERTTIHTAELAAMVASLKWRRLGQWNLFVGDRSALFSAFSQASRINPAWTIKGACTRLH